MPSNLNLKRSLNQMLTKKQNPHTVPKIILISAEKPHLSRLEEVQRFLGQIYHMWIKTGHIPLHPLQPWQSQVFCRDSVVLDNGDLHCGKSLDTFRAIHKSAAGTKLWRCKARNISRFLFCINLLKNIFTSARFEPGIFREGLSTQPTELYRI